MPVTAASSTAQEVHCQWEGLEGSELSPTRKLNFPDPVVATLYEDSAWLIL